MATGGSCRWRHAGPSLRATVEYCLTLDVLSLYSCEIEVDMDCHALDAVVVDFGEYPHFFIGDAVSAEHISAAHIVIMAEMSIRILIFIVLFVTGVQR